MSRAFLLATLVLASLAFAASPASASTDAALGPCDDPGAAAIVTCAYTNGEDLACNAVLGTDDCIRQTYCDLYWVSTEDCWWPNNDLAASSALALVGPCEDPGALAVVYCAAYNGEVLVCNALNGNDDCIRPQDAERLVCYLVYGYPDCLPFVISLPSGTTSGASCYVPSDSRCHPGLLSGVDHLVEDTEPLVCNAAYGYDRCLPCTRVASCIGLALPGTAGSALVVGIGPCEDPGAVAVAKCAEKNGEILVCSAIFGDQSPCITRICHLLMHPCPLDLPAGMSSATLAIGIGPCDDPGVIAVVECAEDNGEILVCSALLGDQSTCITHMCQMMLDNCPLDPKTDSGMAAAIAIPELPAGVWFPPCSGGGGLVAVVRCATYGCAWVDGFGQVACIDDVLPAVPAG